MGSVFLGCIELLISWAAERDRWRGPPGEIAVIEDHCNDARMNTAVREQ
jgi:hypothetical protein